MINFRFSADSGASRSVNRISSVRRPGRSRMAGANRGSSAVLLAPTERMELSKARGSQAGVGGQGSWEDREAALRPVCIFPLRFESGRGLLDQEGTATAAERRMRERPEQPP